MAGVAAAICLLQAVPPALLPLQTNSLPLLSTPPTTAGEGATQAAVRRFGPTTRPLVDGERRLPPQRCHAAPRQSRFRLSAAAGAAEAAAAAAAAADEEEQAAAEQAAEEAAEAAAGTLAAQDDAAVGEAAEAGGGVAEREPLQLELLVQSAVACISRFLEQRCGCPAAHPQHREALRRGTLRALCGLWRPWQHMPVASQRRLLSLICQQVDAVAPAAPPPAAAAAGGAAAAAVAAVAAEPPVAAAAAAEGPTSAAAAAAAAMMAAPAAGALAAMAGPPSIAPAGTGSGSSGSGAASGRRRSSPAELAALRGPFCSGCWRCRLFLGRQLI